ncbi:RNA methyltransferase [uncultured Winogradskyella sp.]|uniref:TrmH family RNA methyltransferase n=1 Tax=uncultured Winogradskyella sp. TaxID=395353 RepID=UPI002638E9E8|nr:RNA methyltransferase [uncultured Winogradskyella sp.]
MLSNNQIKLIKSLSQKKYRQELGLFTVEGIKGVNEFLNSNYKLHKLYTTGLSFGVAAALEFEVTDKELKKISTLKNPNTVLAIFEMPKQTNFSADGLVVALDDVRDPGNLGTIIRLCDWYGVTDLVCSKATVDCYNSKVVQATMGSLTRVNIIYLDLYSFVDDFKGTVYGTFMEGDSIYTAKLPKNGLLILGNEANGISSGLEKKITNRLTIPQFGNASKTESLNVANATAIVLSEFRRRIIEM